MGPRHGVHGALDGDTGFEIDKMRRLAGDPGEDLARLDDLQIIKAEAMARRRTDPTIPLMYPTGGVTGGISAAVSWAIWDVISWIRRSGR